MLEKFKAEISRLEAILVKNPSPCVVCGGEPTAIGTWIPGNRHRLAAGGTAETTPVFAFCLCSKHEDAVDPNAQLAVKQKILRTVRNKVLRS